MAKTGTHRLHERSLEFTFLSLSSTVSKHSSNQGKTMSTLRQSFTAEAHLSVQSGALLR
jgi:hypothetical protein